MTWRNTADGFGLVSRAIHWLMAALLIALLALGTRIESMEPGLANLWLYSLHKSLGLTALALVIARLVWHRLSPPPTPIGPPRSWEVRAARAGHAALYLLMLVVPLSGWVASAATGIDVMLFDRWTLPRIAPVSPAWEDAGFTIHGIATKLLFGLVILHLVAALLRQARGDGTLRRMVLGR
jgi:cytochrome b561